jgi:dihydrodipicolinate synthase/N-acetylneuraminate lyase
VLPALITPFTRTGDLDLEAFAANLTTLTDRGIKGFLVGSSTGEGPYLEPGERAELVDAARDTLGRSPFLVSGVAAESLRLARKQVKEAAAGGADAVLVITPTSLARDRNDLVEQFYLDLADKSPLPVIIYSVPKYTAYEPPIETIAAVAAHENVLGMKDSAGNPVRKAQIVEAAGEDFYLFAGASKAITLSMAAGAYGAITASGNYAPELLLGLVKTARRSSAAATEAQAELTKLSTTVEEHGVAGIKVAAAAAGLEAGHLRRPLRPVPKRAADQIREAMGV